MSRPKTRVQNPPAQEIFTKSKRCARNRIDFHAIGAKTTRLVNKHLPRFNKLNHSLDLQQTLAKILELGDFHEICSAHGTTWDS